MQVSILRTIGAMQRPRTTISVDTSGTYKVTVTSNNGCTGTASEIVTVNPYPTPVISGDSSFCSIDSSLLDAGSFPHYLWNTGSTNETILTDTTGIYIVTVTNSFGCTGTSAKPVIVKPSPVAAFTGDSVICSGNTIVLNPGSFASYNWSTGSTTQTISVDSANTYTVTVTNASGCTGTASRSISVNPNPTPTIGGGDSVCVGDSLMIYTGFYSHYLWSNGDTTSINYIR